MTVNQISIFLENKYGKLSEILALLAEEKIRRHIRIRHSAHYSQRSAKGL